MQRTAAWAIDSAAQCAISLSWPLSGPLALCGGGSGGVRGSRDPEKEGVEGGGGANGGETQQITRSYSQASNPVVSGPMIHPAMLYPSPPSPQHPAPPAPHVHTVTTGLSEKEAEAEETEDARVFGAGSLSCFRVTRVRTRVSPPGRAAWR